MENILGLESWQFLLIVSVILSYTLVAAGWTLAKAGRSPLWVLFLLIPYVNVVALWVFAYIRWPFVDNAAPDGRGTDNPEPS